MILDRLAWTHVQVYTTGAFDLLRQETRSGYIAVHLISLVQAFGASHTVRMLEAAVTIPHDCPALT